MSDSEIFHPAVGGKSLNATMPDSRTQYKSWRKKYRKMRLTFDGVLEENKRLFKDEHQLERIAARLREELDGLLDIALDLNESPAIAPELRFNIRPAPRHPPPIHVDADITPEAAHALLAEYRDAVSTGRIPPLDLHVVRAQIDQRLAAQDVASLEDLSAAIPHPAFTPPPDKPIQEAFRGLAPPGYLTPDQEMAYLARLDAKHSHDPFAPLQPTKAAEQAKLLEQEEKHFAALTPREQERQIELLNPQSQHSWLKTHSKAQQPGGAAGGEVDDNESLASHDHPPPSKPAARRRTGGGGGGATGAKNNLAKQVGDRAVERATREGTTRDGYSPSVHGDVDPDDVMADDVLASGGGSGSGRKRVRDPDGAYRVKGGKGGAGGSKGKRKRVSGEGVEGGGSSKKAKVGGGGGGDEGS